MFTVLPELVAAVLLEVTVAVVAAVLVVVRLDVVFAALFVLAVLVVFDEFTLLEALDDLFENSKKLPTTIATIKATLAILLIVDFLISIYF